MIFKTLVECILKRQRDSDDDMALNALNELTREIQNDLSRAFRIARPLVDRHRSLFWRSRSFLDFLIRVSRLPSHVDHFSDRLPDDDGAERRGESEERREELERCREELETRKAELETCRTELCERRRELETLRDDLEERRSRSVEADERLEECRKQLEEHRKQLLECRKQVLRERADCHDATRAKSSARLAAPPELSRTDDDETTSERLRELERELLECRNALAEKRESAMDVSEVDPRTSELESRLRLAEEERDRLRSHYEGQIGSYAEYVRNLLSINANLSAHYVELTQAAERFRKEFEDARHRAEVERWGLSLQAGQIFDAYNRVLDYAQQIDDENRRLRDVETRYQSTVRIAEVSEPSLPTSVSTPIACVSAPALRDASDQPMEGSDDEDGEEAEAVRMLKTRYRRDARDGDLADSLRRDLDLADRLLREYERFGEEARVNVTLDRYLDLVAERSEALESVAKAARATDCDADAALSRAVLLLDRFDALSKLFPSLASGDLSSAERWIDAVRRWREKNDADSRLSTGDVFEYAAAMVERMDADVELLESLAYSRPEAFPDRAAWREAFAKAHGTLEAVAASLTDDASRLESVLIRLKSEAACGNAEAGWLLRHVEELKKCSSALADERKTNAELRLELNENAKDLKKYFEVLGLTLSKGNGPKFLSKIRELKGCLDFYNRVRKELDVCADSREEVLQKLREVVHGRRQGKGSSKRTESFETEQSEKKMKKDQPAEVEMSETARKDEFYSVVEMQNLFDALYKEYFLMRYNYLKGVVPEENTLKRRIVEKLDILASLAHLSRANWMLKIYEKYVEYDLVTLKNEPRVFEEIVSKDALFDKTRKSTERFLKRLMDSAKTKERGELGRTESC